MMWNRSLIISTQLLVLSVQGELSSPPHESMVIGPNGLANVSELPEDDRVTVIAQREVPIKQGMQSSQHQSFLTIVMSYAFSPYMLVLVGIVDVVIVWLVGNLAWRQRKIKKEDEQRRIRDPVERARRHWSLVRTAVLLAARTAPEGELNRWQTFARLRRRRKCTIMQNRFDMKGVLTWASGFILVPLTLALIAFDAYQFFASGLHWFQLGPSGTAAVSTLAYALLCGTLYNYVMAAVARAKPAHSDGDCQSRNHQRCFKCPGTPLKPLRTHHCKICQSCVSKMDHHCPWIHNCVGQHNYHHFFLFLIFLASTALLFSIGLVPQGIQTVLYFLGYSAVVPRRPVEVIAGSVISAVVFAAITSFASFHIVLLWTNQTTIEYLKNGAARRKAQKAGVPFKSEYDQGWQANIQAVFTTQGRARPHSCGAPPVYP
jgi:hypothetical protein